MHQLPPNAILMQFIMGKFVSRAISTAATAGFADALASGPHDADAVAARCGTQADATFRVLRALSAVGVFAQTGPRSFANTPVSELLRRDRPDSLNAMARWINSPTGWEAWGALDHTVKTGEPATAHLWGEDIFHYMASARPDDFAVFNDAMTSFSMWTASAVVESYDFAGLEQLVDVGGGHGALLAHVLARHTSLTGVLFDLPDVVAGAGDAFARFGVTGRATKAGGNFLEAVPAGADAYIMKHIIHDWDDARSKVILENCRRALRPHGRVLVVEQVIGDTPESTPGKLLDLEMLVMTPGGRERTAEEFATLFRSAGLELTRIVPTHSPVCVIEGRPL